jgi:hypothetical protein
MPTPQQLRAELDGDPLGLGYAALLAAGDDTGVAALLNARVRPGYVPARWVSVSLARYPSLDALIHWCLTHGTLPAEYGGGECPFAVYALFRNLDRVDKSVGAGDLRAAVSDLTAGLAQASAAGLVGAMIPTGFGDYLLSGEVKIGRAEELWGGGVTESDVAKTRGL